MDVESSGPRRSYVSSSLLLHFHGFDDRFLAMLCTPLQLFALLWAMVLLQSRVYVAIHKLLSGVWHVVSERLFSHASLHKHKMLPHLLCSCHLLRLTRFQGSRRFKRRARSLPYSRPPKGNPDAPWKHDLFQDEQSDFRYVSLRSSHQRTYA